MYLFLLNPQSKRANKLKNKIKRYLADLKIPGEFIEVKKKEDQKDIIAEAIERKMEKVVTIGGDGMINKIIPLLVKTDITLGIIPIGETNFFANILGINNWRDGCNSLIKGKTINMNLGKVNGEKYFISSVEIEIKSEEKQKKFLFFSKKKQTKKFMPVSLSIVSDNTNVKLNTEISSILVSTIPIPPPKNFDIEKELGKENLNIVIKNKNNTKNNPVEELTILQGKEINIQSKSSLDVKIDGDYFCKTPVDISLASNCLKVIKF